MLQLKSEEKTLLKNLMDQEMVCIKKYENNANFAKDTVLKDLFSYLKTKEQNHYHSLNQMIQGTLPQVSGQYEAVSYNPQPTYTDQCNVSDKENDKFLTTDSISTEKYVSSSYNNDLFQFSDTNVRKVLNHIETEEQQHAERLWIYKTVNNMIN